MNRPGTGLASPGHEPGPEQPIVGASEEERDAEAVVGDLVSPGSWDAADEPVEPEAAQVVGHAARGEVFSAELTESLAEVGVGEAVREQTKEDEGMEESLDPCALEAEGGRPLVGDEFRTLDLMIRRSAMHPFRRGRRPRREHQRNGQVLAAQVARPGISNRTSPRRSAWSVPSWRARARALPRSRPSRGSHGR